jgi:DNA ligase (NAD+)
MDIVGLGIKIVEQLVVNGLVKDVADLYKLNRNELLALEGFAEKKADNILYAIEDSRNRSLSRLIIALGIRGVGEVVAAELAHFYPDLDMLARALIEDLQNIEGIGPNIAQAIVDWFSRSTNRLLLEKLRLAGVWPKELLINKLTKTNRSLTGLIFVITGTFEGFTRDEMKVLIQENGGKVTDSVSNNTSYLLVGEEPGSKLDKAKKIRIPILDINGFRELLGRGEIK